MPFSPGLFLEAILSRLSNKNPPNVQIREDKPGKKIYAEERMPFPFQGSQQGAHCSVHS